LPVPIDALSNTATITWDAQNGPPDQGGLPAGSLDTLAVPVAFTEDIIDECIDATDAFNGGAAGVNGINAGCGGAARTASGGLNGASDSATATGGFSSIPRSRVPRRR